jgi:hypothetical protein
LVNIIGFNFPNSSKWVPTKHCIIHHGTRLVSKLDEPGVLWCTQCGMPYTEKDTAAEERFNPEFGPSNKTNIISAKNKKKKYYDKQGNEINDQTLLDDIARGATVISYHEEKSGEDSSTIDKKRRIVRR